MEMDFWKKVNIRVWGIAVLSILKPAQKFKIAKLRQEQNQPIMTTSHYHFKHPTSIKINFTLSMLSRTWKNTKNHHPQKKLRPHFS